MSRGDLSNLYNDKCDVNAYETAFNLERAEKFLHDNGMETGGTLRSSSIIAGGAASGIMRAQMEAQAEKDRQNTMETQVLLASLNDRIRGYNIRLEEIGQRIEGIDQRVAEIDEDLAALDDLGNAIEGGSTLTPEQEALMKKYGITQEDVKADTAKIKIAQAKTGLKSERGTLQSERTDLVLEDEDVRAKRDRDISIRDQVRSGRLDAQDVQAKAGVLVASLDGQEEASEIAVTSQDVEVLKTVADAGDTVSGNELYSDMMFEADEAFGGEISFGEPTVTGMSAAKDIDGFALSTPDMAGEFKSASADATRAVGLQNNLGFESEVGFNPLQKL